MFTCTHCAPVSGPYRRSDTDKIHGAASCISQWDFDGIQLGISWPRAILESNFYLGFRYMNLFGNVFPVRFVSKVLTDILHYLCSC